MPAGSRLYRERNGNPVLLKKAVIATGDQIRELVEHRILGIERKSLYRKAERLGIALDREEDES